MNKTQIHIRISQESDYSYLLNWLLEKEALRWFPMTDQKEIEEAVRHWLSYRNFGACITAEIDGIPCGSATLYLHAYKKLKHQALFSIVVDQKFRGRGVGKTLIQNLEKLAKDFGIEVFYLEVYEGNPAKHLYEKLGFIEFGRHPKFVKENNHYYDKLLMQKLI